MTSVLWCQTKSWKYWQEVIHIRPNSLEQKHKVNKYFFLIDLFSFLYLDVIVIKTANRIVGFYSIYKRANEIRWQIPRTGSRNVTYFTSKRIKYCTKTFKNINFCNILPIYTEIISKTSVLSSNKPHFSWNYCSCTRTESFTAWLQLGVY